MIVFSHIYENEKINLDKRINIDVKEKNVEFILDQIFKNEKINYSITGNKLILITPLKSTLNNQLVEEGNNAQQQKSVSGKVTDQAGIPIPGASVIVKGTTIGTSTSIDGNFSLSITSDAKVLVFSFVGMRSQEFTIEGKTTINVTLADDAIGLEDVVIVGYGTQKKVNLTGSISSVKSDELTSIPTQTITQAIMGKASGVFIKNTNGQPGDLKGIEFSIRGFGDPLIIIDGVPGTKQELNQLDPSDIEEFNILKDAASGAVYGARAGNGVILVKTKRGTLSEAKITYTSN